MKFHWSVLIFFGLVVGPSFLVTLCAAKQGQGYLWADDSAQDLNTPYHPHAIYSYNSAHGPINITRTNTGVYLNFSAKLCQGSSNKHSFAIASAYGNGNLVCNVIGWGFPSHGFEVSVQCVDLAGHPADSLYTLQVLCNS